MDTTLLKTFLEVAKNRHFGKAADALYVTQSAVSARIKLLESNLAVQLFIRRRNDIQLTPAGMRLVRYAETIVKGWERVRHEIALGEKGGESIALGCPFDLWQILLRDWAIKLRNQSPDLVLQIEVQPAEILISRLVNGLLDLAILFEPPQISGLIIKQVAEISLLLVTSQQDASMEEVMKQNYFMVDWGSVFALQHAEYFPDIPPPAARVASGTLALDLILETGGAAYLARQTVAQQLDHNMLFIVDAAPVIERRAFAIYRPEDENKGYLKNALKVMHEHG